MTADYTLTILNTNTESVSNNMTIGDHTFYTGGTTWRYDLYGEYHYCSGWGCGHVHYWPWSLTPEKIYLYQVTCPKCKTNNWLELEKITPCTKCESTIKATTKKVDYEVPVNV